MKIEKTAVAALVLQRQYLQDSAGKKEYDWLFRKMSPVPTAYWCCPGDPPYLSFRADFDDYQECFQKRSKRELAKGRFQGGNIAYIFADEWELFGAVYRRQKPPLSQGETRLIELLEKEGPMTVKVIKEFTGMLVREITPLLQKLQERMLVFENQVDNEWDRSWHLFQEFFPDVQFDRISRKQALQELLLRFVSLNGWVDAAMARSFYRLPIKELQAALSGMALSGKLSEAELDGAKGYILPEDQDFLCSNQEPAKGVFAFHRNDFLVKSREPELKGKFQKDGLDILYYLLIDGFFQGVVLGHFKNGPFILEDIVLELGQEEAAARKQEILAAVYRVNDPAASPIQHYLREPV